MIIEYISELGSNKFRLTTGVDMQKREIQYICLFCCINGQSESSLQPYPFFERIYSAAHNSIFHNNDIKFSFPKPNFHCFLLTVCKIQFKPVMAFGIMVNPGQPFSTHTHDQNWANPTAKNMQW